MDNVTARLENWGGLWNNLYGEIYDDIRCRWKDGQHVQVSRTDVAVDEMKEGDIIKTRNSTYLLGKPCYDKN